MYTSIFHIYVYKYFPKVQKQKLNFNYFINIKPSFIFNMYRITEIYLHYVNVDERDNEQIVPAIGLPDGLE